MIVSRRLRLRLLAGSSLVVAMVGAGTPLVPAVLAQDSRLVLVAPVVNGSKGPDATASTPGGSGGGGSDASSYSYAAISDYNGNGSSPTVLGQVNGGRGGDGGDGVNTSTFKLSDRDAGSGGTGGSGGTLAIGLSGQIYGGASNAVLLQGNGGGGGNAGIVSNDGTGGNGGSGGSGGTIDLSARYGMGLAATSTGGYSAVRLDASGGAGGDGSSTSYEIDRATGGNGGNGGNGGTIAVDVTGPIRSATTGIFVTGLGGNGGRGGNASSQGPEQGGNGGNGGAGGYLTLNLTDSSVTAAGGTETSPAGSTSATVTVDSLRAGLLAISAGGSGGNGGRSIANLGEGVGGTGSSGGTGGGVTAALTRTAITTTGATAGVLLQSLGASGGAGAPATAAFVAGGGGAGSAGDAAFVLFQSTQGSIGTSGNDADALVAQSIAGIGGYGGSATTAALIYSSSVGGNGGGGGNASSVTLFNGSPTYDQDGDLLNYAQGSAIRTIGDRSAAILAQSIAGNGGRGGDASATTQGGFSSYSIGGVGATGGSAALSYVRNNGVLSTSGAGSSGVVAQSIGGGGGFGGSAFSLTSGAQITSAVSVGGSGGVGGDGGAVDVGNLDLVVASGANSFGMVAQSIGGGGGIGGAASSSTFQAPGSEDFPSVQITASVGGSGGTGGSGGKASIGNAGVVLTAGGGGVGILAQSIGGGGGSGGDAQATARAYEAADITVTLGIGGTGGTGGTSDSVNVTNSGLIMTLGRDASGIVAQAINGGGGIGGYGHAAAGAVEEGKISTEIGIGGAGGGAGGPAASSVTVENTGGIATLGDGSRAIMAQSIGGGGGAGSGGVANGGGGETINARVAVGGSGGAGADGGTVFVSNQGSILTGGANGDAISAQSIGGGGGKGGDASTGSGTEPQIELAKYLASGVGIGNGVIETADDAYVLNDTLTSQYNQLAALKGYASAYSGLDALSAPNGGSDAVPTGEAEEEKEVSFNVAVSVAGSAGSSGNGGTIQIVNGGAIETKGPKARAILAQSIGGGGGIGGAAAASNSNATVNGSVAIGGNGSAVGNGGGIGVANSGALLTLGDESHAIFAQSVGGGGGEAGLGSAKSSSFKGLAVSVGGNGSAAGAGGSVSISNSASVETRGDGAIGLFGQSVGGGGGIFTLMQTEEGAAREDGSESEAEKGRLDQLIVSLTPKDVTPLRFTISGSGQSGANGGGVDISTGSTVSTAGRNAYAILAQSIGGGGTFATGLESDGSALFNGGNVGTGGNVYVQLQQGSQLRTTGDGAVGILAQTIGGGGGIVGGMADIDLDAPVHAVASTANLGQGGDVTVALQQSSVTTSGARAHGIVAQSAGGGGGFIAGGAGGDVMAGSDAGLSTAVSKQLCSGAACTGHVTVSLVGSTVAVTGAGAHGIYASSLGNENTAGTASERVDVTLDAGSRVTATSAPAVMLVGRNNYLTNNGTISVGSGTAVFATGGTIVNTGTIVGDLRHSNDGWVSVRGMPVDNRGSITANAIEGSVQNLGTLAVRSSAVGTLRIGGDLANAGAIAVNVVTQGTGSQFTALADQIVVDGTAHLAGTLNVNLTGDLGKFDLPVLTATTLSNEGIKMAEQRGSILLVSSRVVGNQLRIASNAFVGNATQALGANQAALGSAIQATFDKGGTAIGGVSLAALNRSVSAAGLADALRSLSGNVLGAVAATRSGTARTIFAAIVDCPEPGPDGWRSETDCTWVRGNHIWGERDTSASVTGYTSSSDGVQFGFQRGVADDWKLGLIVAYQDSRFLENHGATRIDGKDFTVGASVRYTPGDWSFAAGVTGGLGHYRSAREVTVGGLTGTARATPDTQSGAIHGRVAFTRDLGALYVRPQLDVNASLTHVDAYRERDAAYALAFDGRSAVTGTALPAVEVGTRMDIAGLEVRPFLKGGAVLQTGNDWAARARFVGSDERFRSATELPDVMGNIGGGFTVASSSRLDLRAQYDADLAGNYRQQNATLRLSYRF